MTTAFQRNAFQDNAFQIASLVREVTWPGTEPDKKKKKHGPDIGLILDLQSQAEEARDKNRADEQELAKRALEDAAREKEKIDHAADIAVEQLKINAGITARKLVETPRPDFVPPVKVAKKPKTETRAISEEEELALLLLLSQ